LGICKELRLQGKNLKLGPFKRKNSGSLEAHIKGYTTVCMAGSGLLIGHMQSH
jgi:hypothetical protein